MAAGAGTGVRGAGVVAKRTWAEHQKRCLFPMDPIDSAGVDLDLDPNEPEFVRPYLHRREENTVAGLMTSHESKSLDQKNM